MISKLSIAVSFRGAQAAAYGKKYRPGVTPKFSRNKRTKALVLP